MPILRASTQQLETDSSLLTYADTPPHDLLPICQRLFPHTLLQLRRPPAFNGPISLSGTERQIIVYISRRMSLSDIAAALASSSDAVRPIIVSLIERGLAEIVVADHKEFIAMPERSRSEQILDALDKLIRTNFSDITGAAVMTRDGMLVASRMGVENTEDNPDRTATIAATVMGVTSRVASELKMGRTRETIIRAEGGYLLVMPISSQVILTLMLRSGANLGLARIDAQNACRLISATLYNGTGHAVGGQMQEQE